jgi:hypothetical protein
MEPVFKWESRHCYFALLFILLISLLSINCAEKKEPPPPPPPPFAPADNIEKQKTIEERVTGLEVAVNNLNNRISNIDSIRAYVSTEDEGYGIAKTKHGSFTVSCEGVTPYLDGYKVKLSIGNLTSATFNGFKLIVRPHAIGKEDKEYNLTNTLAPGSYTHVTISVTPAKPDEIKRLMVGLELDQISLRK